MTDWVNMFDAGACTVSVYYNPQGDGSDTALYAGTLGKGDASPTFSGHFGETLQASVDGDGVVSLLTGNLAQIGYCLMVNPQYDISQLATQIIDIETGANAVSGWTKYGEAEVLHTKSEITCNSAGGPTTPASDSFSAGTFTADTNACLAVQIAAGI